MDDGEKDEWLAHRGSDPQAPASDDGGSTALSALRHQCERFVSLTNLFLGPPNQGGIQVRDGKQYHLYRSPLLGYSHSYSWHSNHDYNLIHQGQEGLFEQSFRHEHLGDKAMPMALVCLLLFMATIVAGIGLGGAVSALLGALAGLPLCLLSFVKTKAAFESTDNRRFKTLTGDGLKRLVQCERLTRAGSRYVRSVFQSRDPYRHRFTRLNGSRVYVAEIDGAHYVLQDGWFKSTLRRFSSESGFESFVGQKLPSRYETLVDETETV